MANICSNTLKIVGTEEQVKEVLEFIKPDSESELIEDAHEEYFDFNKVIPEPEGLTEEEQYDWRVENWESRWSPYNQFLDSGILGFTTHWCVPIKVMETLSEKFPEVAFKLGYFIDGYGVCGEIKWRGGNPYYSSNQDVGVDEDGVLEPPDGRFDLVNGPIPFE